MEKHWNPVLPVWSVQVWKGTVSFTWPILYPKPNKGTKEQNQKITNVIKKFIYKSLSNINFTKSIYFRTVLDKGVGMGLMLAKGPGHPPLPR